MGYMPLMVDVAQQLTVVVGAGSAAGVKVRSLLAAQARVRVVSPQVNDEFLQEAIAQQKVQWVNREYQPGDQDGAFMVVAATSDHDTNLTIVRDARALGRLCLDAGEVTRGNVMFSSILQKGPFTISVSSGGRAPAATRALHDYLSHQIGDDWVRYGDLLYAVRQMVKSSLPYPQRRQVLRKMAQLPWRELIANGQEPMVWQQAQALIREAEHTI